MKYPNRLNTTREREELTGRCLLGTMERTIPKTIAKRRESESQRCIEEKWGRDRDRCSRRRINCKIQENRGTKTTKMTLGQKTNKNSRKKEKQIKKRKRMRKRKREKKREKMKRKWEIISCSQMYQNKLVGQHHRKRERAKDKKSSCICFLGK